MPIRPQGSDKALRRSEKNIEGGFQSGQMGQTVNLLSFDFGGSNPSPPTPEKGSDVAEIAQLIEH